MSGQPWTEQEIATVERMVGEGATRREIANALGRTMQSVDHHRNMRGGLAIKRRGAPPRAIPADFAEKWALMPITALAKHYRAGPNAIRAWAAELGLSRTSAWRSEPFKAKPPAPKAEKKAMRLPDVTPIGRGLSLAPADTYQRDMSPAGQAADYLRHFGAVYRCDAAGRAVDTVVSGRANPDATHWRWGNAVMTSSELIERAASKRRREADRRAA